MQKLIPFRVLNVIPVLGAGIVNPNWLVSVVKSSLGKREFYRDWIMSRHKYQDGRSHHIR